MSSGRLKVAAGAACFAILLYWIVALHLNVPGSAFFETLYSQRTARRGPWGMGVLVLGGLSLIAWGLRDLGGSGEGDDDSF